MLVSALVVQNAVAQADLDVALRELNSSTTSLSDVRKWAAAISTGSPKRFNLTPEEYAAAIISLARRLAGAGEASEGVLNAGLSSLKAAGGDVAYANLLLLDELAATADRAEKPAQALDAQRQALEIAKDIWGEHPTLLPRLRAIEARLSRLNDTAAASQLAANRKRREAIEAEYKIDATETITMGQGERRQAEDSELVTVHFATNRVLVAREDAFRMFGGERDRGATELRFGAAKVSVPRSQPIVGLPEGRYWVGEYKPVQYRKATVVGASLLDSRVSFLNSIGQSIRASGRQELLVYVHGFATDWPTSLQRSAALSVALGIDGATVLLSWPSRGDVLSYVADANELTAAISRQFGSVLDGLLESTGAQRVILVAHSMGARFALSGLEQSVRFRTNSRPFAIVFGSPDVDAADFQDRTRALIVGRTRATLYASRTDKALKISQRINQSPRAGDATSRIAVPGLEVIDTTGSKEAEWSFDSVIAHNDFAISALDDFRAVVWHGLPADRRCILVPTVDAAAAAPWRIASPARCRVETFRFATFAARQMGVGPAGELIERERKKACPASPDDCNLWSETAQVLRSVRSMP